MIEMSAKKNTFPNVNLVKTGALLKNKTKEYNMTVKELQDYLKLSCPQPIYRWYKGQVLPSVDNLYLLSRLFDVHMEELLVINEYKEREDLIIKESIVRYQVPVNKYIIS
jgi:transcriptional regulator with XRE-family HTH domain